MTIVSHCMDELSVISAFIRDVDEDLKDLTIEPYRTAIMIPAIRFMRECLDVLEREVI